MAQVTATAKPARRWNFQQMNEIGLIVIIALLHVAFWFYARNFLTFNNQVTILREIGRASCRERV